MGQLDLEQLSLRDLRRIARDDPDEERRTEARRLVFLIQEAYTRDAKWLINAASRDAHNARH